MDSTAAVSKESQSDLRKPKASSLLKLAMITPVACYAPSVPELWYTSTHQV